MRELPCMQDDVYKIISIQEEHEMKRFGRIIYYSLLCSVLVIWGGV